MKKFIVTFLKRGALFAGSGPVILAIVYFFLQMNGVVSTVSVTRLITEILSATALAFIAAGISAVHTVDRMQPPVAGLIQGAVLFLDYIFFYLANGWLPFKWQAIALFTALFAVIFAAIWVIIYFSIKGKIAKMNDRF